MKFAEIFKSLRKDKELTQEQLAEVLGVSPQIVSRWENGVSQPSLELLPTIASYFETSAGGIAVGAVAALLLAPTSGAELRGKIIELLKSKGISKERFDELVTLITERVKSFTNMNDLEIVVDEVLAEEGEVQQNAKQ